jgi:RNA polymerase sigma factor (sigma-70 family)
VTPEEWERQIAQQEPKLRLLFTHLAGARLRAHVELDDLVQECLLRALSSRTRPPDDAAELGRWLASLARHTAIDAARALRTRRRSAQVVRLERADWSCVGLRESRVADRAPGVATRLGRDEDQARVLAAFERLAPEHRRVIGLRQFEGLSAAEAAARLQRSESAVHSLYRRALQAWAEAAR